MITYKEFVDKMIEKGYTLNKESPTIINNKNDMISTYSVKKGQIGKIVELNCPENQIIALCGTTHIGGCEDEYFCNVKCYNTDNDEPFQDRHNSTALDESNHVVAEIIVTKILQKEAPKDNKKVQDWSEKIAPILKLIKSKDSLEHIMLTCAYPILNSEFTKTSFTLYGGQKMTFYINDPDIDVERVEFEMKADIFEKLTWIYISFALFYIRRSADVNNNQLQLYQSYYIVVRWQSLAPITYYRIGEIENRNLFDIIILGDVIEHVPN